MPEHDNAQFWEQKYAAGHQQRYPWDSVVSFVYRYAPKDRPRAEVKILEVGCGTGSNLWFAAREGFSVSGLEVSASAVKTAQARFRQEGLKGEFKVGHFGELPFGDAAFDMVIDRGALTCGTYEEIEQAIEEIARVAKRGAFFMFTPFCDSHSSFYGGGTREGRTIVDIQSGSVAGIKQVTFLSGADVMNLLRKDWSLLLLQRMEITTVNAQKSALHAEWHAVAQRL